MLEKINTPEDIRGLSFDELDNLADELRAEIIQTTLRNGGHLASSLGAVDLTLAIHYVFHTPEDKLIFDVGHQCYAHKLITGRREQFSTLREKGGISGFPSADESEYDTFSSGHSSTAISTALGMARARDAQGENYHVIALVGDGAIGGGVALEGLNDAGADRRSRLIIILNDNEMSISRNVGALSSHFARLRTAKRYRKYKSRLRASLDRVNRSGRLRSVFEHLKNTVRYFLMGQTLFDTMGLKYLGPVDGHSIPALVNILERAKNMDTPVVIHAITCKGCGYHPAAENPEKFHGVSPRCGTASGTSFAACFGQTVCALAKDDPAVCAVTAGMTMNTGLQEFAGLYPNRFFDAGIAEQHAIAMAAGLAKGGMRPFVVIYATFLQRGLDQVFHEVCLQHLPVVICADHAGLVGEDGVTHNGVFDLAFLRTMPGLEILAPRDPDEFGRMLVYAHRAQKPVVIRYPKGSCAATEGTPFETPAWDVLRKSEKGYFLSFGTCLREALAAAEETGLGVIDTRSLKPLDAVLLRQIAGLPLYTVEDNAPEGGLCEAVLHFYSAAGIPTRVRGFALKEQFTAHATVEEQLAENGLDAAALVRGVRNEA